MLELVLAASLALGIPADWDRTAAHLLLYLSSNSPQGALFELAYAPNAYPCTAAEFDDTLREALPNFVSRSHTYARGEWSGLLLEEADDYVGMAELSFTRTDTGLLYGRPAVIVSHGFFHLHFARDGRITSCAAYFRPGTTSH